MENLAHLKLVHKRDTDAPHYVKHRNKLKCQKKMRTLGQKWAESCAWNMKEYSLQPEYKKVEMNQQQFPPRTGNWCWSHCAEDWLSIRNSWDMIEDEQSKYTRKSLLTPKKWILVIFLASSLKSHMRILYMRHKHYYKGYFHSPQFLVKIWVKGFT